MRFRVVVAAIALSLFLFAGCFEVETVITVKRDGSGTVREHVVLKNDMMVMMLSMAKRMRNGDDEQENKTRSLFSIRELEEKAMAMGEGVTFQSGTILREDGEGYDATYTFKDINTLRLRMTPDMQAPEDEEVEDSEHSGDTGGEKYFVFEFHKGSPATLIIHTPRIDRATGDDSEEEQSDEENEQGLEMARMMLKDLRLSVVVNVDGTVVESDATFRERSKIILTDIDFDKLTADENLIRAAAKSNTLSDEKAKELMKTYPGLKIELNKTTTVRFR